MAIGAEDVQKVTNAFYSTPAGRYIFAMMRASDRLKRRGVEFPTMREIRNEANRHARSYSRRQTSPELLAEDAKAGETDRLLKRLDEYEVKQKRERVNTIMQYAEAKRRKGEPCSYDAAEAELQSQGRI